MALGAVFPKTYNNPTMKKYLLTLLLAAITGLLWAQDAAIFNHYVQSPIMLNPGAAGFADEYQLQLNARASWSGFEDSPKTVVVRLNGPVGKSFGIGGAIFNESAAQQSRLKGQLDVAFRFGIGDEVKGVAPLQLAFGFFTQFERVTVDNSVLNNPLIQAGDEVLMAYINGENQFDAGIGIYGSYLNNTFGGLTINNLVSNRLNNISGATSDNNFNYTLLLGHTFNIADAGVNLTPSLMMRDVQGAPFMLDFNLQAGFLDDQLITGLSYRYLGALGLLLGTKLQGFRLYYSYDLSFSDFQQFSNGSHEVTVGYNISRVDLKAKRDQRARQQNLNRR